MTDTLTLNLLGLDNSFPDNLWVVFHPISNTYGCYHHQSIDGLAVFSTEHRATEFSKFENLDGTVTQETTFEEAREIAKKRPMPVVAIMFLDDISDPLIHYVK